MSQYQELFDYLLQEHGVFLEESELKEIEQIVLNMHDVTITKMKKIY